MRRSRLFPVLLWLVFAFAMGQQVALQHGLGHALDKTTPAVHCGDCGLLAQLSGPAGDALPAVAVVAAALSRSEGSPVQIGRRHVVHFLSQGPPAFS
jgi:hypothetical protein